MSRFSEQDFYEAEKRQNTIYDLEYNIYTLEKIAKELAGKRVTSDLLTEYIRKEKACLENWKNRF